MSLTSLLSLLPSFSLFKLSKLVFLYISQLLYRYYNILPESLNLWKQSQFRPSFSITIFEGFNNNMFEAFHIAKAKVKAIEKNSKIARVIDKK